jgi:hypothetical protein
MSVWVEVSACGRGDEYRGDEYQSSGFEHHKECKDYCEKREYRKGENEITAFFSFDLPHASPSLAML